MVTMTKFSVSKNLLLCLAFLLTACTTITSEEAAVAVVVPTTPPTPTHTAATHTPGPPPPIEVTYVTPSQTEGPYYPVNKPADRDNDLVELEGAAGLPEGDILEFGGTLYDGAGMPVAGAIIEIWQTDNNGIYLHPQDPQTSRRDRNFQSYGEAMTAEDGRYRFRTIVPGHYEPRPRHIHVKVKRNNQELLTTQFYFDNDAALASNSIFARAQGDQLALIMAVTPGTDSSGNPILRGERDIILRSQ